MTTFGGNGCPRQIDFRVMKSGSMAASPRGGPVRGVYYVVRVKTGVAVCVVLCREAIAMVDGDGRNGRVGVERKDSQVCQVEGVRLGVKVRFSSAAVVW
jgi:hypothetical protein